MGEAVGAGVGEQLGAADGTDVGTPLGTADGTSVGDVVGDGVGLYSFGLCSCGRYSYLPTQS